MVKHEKNLDGCFLFLGAFQQAQDRDSARCKRTLNTKRLWLSVTRMKIEVIPKTFGWTPFWNVFRGKIYTEAETYDGLPVGRLLIELIKITPNEWF